MMKRTLLAATAVAVAGLFGAAPADAQDYPDYTFDLGIFGGGSWYSAMLDDEHLGEGTDNVAFKPGWVTGLQATFWFTPRFGLRAHGAYTERPIEGGDEGLQDEDGNLLDDVNLWSASGDLMIRLTSNTGAKFLPYLALGVGAKNTNAWGQVAIPGTDGEEGTAFAPQAGRTFYLAEEWALMGLAGLGADVRMADNFGLRLEVGDRFWDATLYEPAATTDPEEDVGKVIHEVYGQLGLHLLMGLQEPEVIAVAPAPPAPAPAPEPEPEPEPIEENIRVCVIDPGAEGGIQMVDAIYLPETRDTMVVVNGERRMLQTTLPRVTLANEADWFVRGEPLAMQVAPDYTIEYTTWQSARMIEADELTYLGDVRGVPVYAANDDAADFQDQLEDLREARMDNDLAAILEENRELRREVEEIQYLYVPLRPTGCVFQTVRQVEQVRKK